jgi:hypothetical protein
MKKKTLLIICSFVSVCYAETDLQTEEEQACSMVQEALAEDDFFFDFPDDLQDNVDEQIEAPCRLHDLATTLGVQAVLGVMCISEVCSESYAWLVAKINCLKKKV